MTNELAHLRKIQKHTQKETKPKPTVPILPVRTAHMSVLKTVMIDFKMCCLYVVLDLPGSVETHLK